MSRRNSSNSGKKFIARARAREREQMLHSRASMDRPEILTEAQAEEIEQTSARLGGRNVRKRQGSETPQGRRKRLRTGNAIAGSAAAAAAAAAMPSNSAEDEMPSVGPSSNAMLQPDAIKRKKRLELVKALSMQKKSSDAGGDSNGRKVLRRRRRRPKQSSQGSTALTEGNTLAAKEEAKPQLASHLPSSSKADHSGAGSPPSSSDAVLASAASSARAAKPDKTSDALEMSSTPLLHWCPGPVLPRWNITSVFHQFLLLGAGKDDNGRSLPFFNGESPALHIEKRQFFREHNVRFVLNMASMDKELHGMSYPVPKGSIRALCLPMQDVDEFTQDMASMFDKGAAFIEEACRLHLTIKGQLKRGECKTRPVSIFVHCVAGVHRSAMAVVWWMVKYHGWNLRDAWGTVRGTRDKACGWTNVTLGGSPDTGRKSNWFTGCWNILTKANT